MKSRFLASFGMTALLLALAAMPAAAQNKTNVAHQQYLGLVADPANVVKGSAFYRSDLDTLRLRAGDIQYWDGSAWVSFPRPTNGVFSRLNSIRVVEPTLWPGGTVTADIDAAISDCASAACLVLYPSNLGAGEATTIPENTTVLDLRQTVATPPTAGFVPGLLLRRRLTTAPGVNFRSLGGQYIYVDAFDGGQYNSTSKNTYSPLHLELDGRTQGQHILIGGRGNGYGIGDALFLGGDVWGYGGKNVAGTSQPTAEFAEINVKQGATVFTAQTLNNEAPSATVIEYTSDTNESVLGERALINTSRTTTTGSVSSISGTDVTFSGAPDWTTLSPSPVGQYFKINSEDVTLGGTSTGHWYRVASVVSATVLRLEATYDTNRLASSGAYTLAQGAEIQSFDTTANSVTIEANSYDWAAADNLICPPMPLLSFRGLNLILTKEFKVGTSRAINISNTGPFAWYTGILLEGAPAGANAFDDGIAITAKVDDAIDLASGTIASAAIKLAADQKLRWGTASDFFFTATGSTFRMLNGLSVDSVSGSVVPLRAKQTVASPSVSYFLLESSTNAVMFQQDQNGVVNIKPAFGTGLKLDPNTGPTLAAVGGNTNIVLDLISKGTGTVRVNAQASTGTGGFAVYDGAATPKLMFSVTNAGVGNNGAAFKHGRVTTGSVGAGASAAVTLTWTTAFADANYTVTCSLAEATASTSTLRLHHLESVAAGSVVARVVNDDGVNPKTGTLHCTAIHD